VPGFDFPAEMISLNSEQEDMWIGARPGAGPEV